MKTSTPLILLGTIGALSAASSGLAETVDTSAWICSSCPYETGVTGNVQVGLGHVSKDAARFADRTGLDKGAFLDLGGEVRFRNGNGQFGSASATRLGLDSRSLAAEFGQEGRFALDLAYDEVPRRHAFGALTPYLGVGGNALTLPAGYPADTTAAMPLATTLRAVDIESRWSRLETGLSMTVGEHMTYRLSARHEVRDGTRPGYGSFFSTASQLVLPVDEVTNQLEAAATYAGRQLQVTVAYHVSDFRNGQRGLTWASPFSPVGAGAGVGQLSLAPDNQFHQLSASAGYRISPILRGSADLAIGRLTQDEAYLPATQNPNLAVTVPVLPSNSLRGRADTLNGNLALTATPVDGLRLTASYARNVRDNRTARGSYPAVSTDMFLGTVPRTNEPYSFWQDRVKLIGDYRASERVKASLGAEYDERQRSYQEVVKTRETTLWGRVGAQAREDLSLSMKLSHARRNPSAYGTANWNESLQNPRLRKFNLAERRRDAAALRADWTPGERLSVGLGVDLADDDYSATTLGLIDGRSRSIHGDLAYALSEQTRFRLFASGETARSRQTGSQVYAAPDWSGEVRDRFETLGLGASHTAMDGKLELGADLSFSRARSRIEVDRGQPTSPFPANTTRLDRFKLHLSYKLKDNMTLVGSYWHERFDARDWALDGVLPGTVPYLLGFGLQAPQYKVDVLGIAVRYRF